MRDPYSVLGVPKSATEADIKKAYRKLAKQFHPDQNKDPKAAARFAEINSANEILADTKKRAQFDRGEIDAEGKPRFQGFEGAGAGGGPFGGGGARGFEFNFGRGGAGRRGGGASGADFEDILSQVFGGRAGAGPRGFEGAPRGEDVEIEAAVPFTTWALGGKARVSLPNGRTVEVAVPAGIGPDKAVRLKGQGEASGFGGEAGDALVTIRPDADPRFRAEGPHVRVDVTITLEDAVLGGKVRVPTLDGSVDLTIPAGTTGGRVMRLKGKGVQVKGEPGDLLVTPRIVLDGRSDPDLENLLRKRRG